MGRKANPEAKTNRITLCGKPDQEVEIRAMKKICARNGLDISDELYHYGVKAFLRAHNWPPGSSQTLLQVFGTEGKKFCGLCGAETDKLYDCLFISGLRKWVCEHCKNEAKEKTTLKHVYGMR